MQRRSIFAINLNININTNTPLAYRCRLFLPISMPKRARLPSSPPLSLPRCAKRNRPSPSRRASPQAHLALTYERLAFHDSLAENQANSASMSATMPPPSSTTGAASSRSASPSKSSESKVRDNEDKLRYYGIHFNNRRALPACLQAFVDELKASADPTLDAVRSPNARHVVQRQRRAQRLAEQDGIDLLKDVLLFGEDDEDLPMLAVKAKQNLDKRYLPPPIDLAWVKDYGALEGPQPDHLYGYRHCKDSDSTTTAFSMQQEYGLLSRAVTSALHFPFMSAQWKSPKNNQTHFQARPQGTIPCSVQRN
jgi:hypothetical protein